VYSYFDFKRWVSKVQEMKRDFKRFLGKPLDLQKVSLRVLIMILGGIFIIIKEMLL